MTPPIQAIIFDYGGVLLRWDPRRIFQRFFPEGPQAVQAFLDEIGFMEWNLQQDAGRSFAEAIAEHSLRFPQYAEILRAYDTDWGNSIFDSIPGSVAILRRLKQAGYPLFGLTNYSAEKFGLDRRPYDFFDLFDDMIVSGEVGVCKPDPAIFELLLAKIGRPAQECLFIDDVFRNVEGARRLGINAVQFQSPEQLESDLHVLGVL